MYLVFDAFDCIISIVMDMVSRKKAKGKAKRAAKANDAKCH